MSCSSQYKITTGTGDQAWACTTASARDSAATYLVLRSAVAAGGRTTKNTRAFPLGTEIGMNWRGAA
jgi:hypothetical protein